MRKKNALKIQLLGEFRMVNKSFRFPQEKKKSMQLVLLIAYLITNQNKMCLKEDLMKLLWQEEESDNPEGALRNLVYRARKELQKFYELPDTCSQLYLAIQGELSAVICISDPLREEAAQVLEALRRTGIQQTVMLTGDSKRTAAHIAKQIGVDMYKAEVLPADKASFIAQQKEKGHIVIMVGDGINDSPALSESNIGIAVQDGAAIAQEVADITIASDSLWELVILRELSQALVKRIERNYKFVIGFNAGLILFGLFGLFPPATSAMLHNLSTLGVSLHSMQPLLKQK